MRRRLDRPGSFDVWPVFTDALSGLVMVLVFLLTIFVIGETWLAHEVSGRDSAIGRLDATIAQLRQLAFGAERRADSSAARVRELEETVAGRDLDLADLRAALAQAEAGRTQLDAELAHTRQAAAAQQASLSAARDQAQTQAAVAGTRITSLEQRVGELLAELQRLNAALGARDAESSQLREQQQAAALQAQQLADELGRQQAAAQDAQTQAAAQIGELEAALTAQSSELAARQTRIGEQEAHIAELDRQIRARLVERVEQLQRYASEFFGRLRQVFENNPDIKVVGDRFVFQSEVLFDTGQARLNEAAKPDLDKFVNVYRQLAGQLPDDLPVVIQVIGHTDHVPVGGGRFRSNWELSSARAQAVVDYLITQGIPPQRLAAVGMGEFHPLDTGDDAEALRRNRRIELKITSL